MKFWTDYFNMLVDEYEGTAWENDPSDPGNHGDGKTPGNVGTKFGVDSRSHPGVDVVHLTREQASEIYLSEFNKSAASKFPEPFSECYFDFAMNAGEGSAARALQRLLCVTVDGAVGPVTIASAEHEIADKGMKSVIARFCGNRGHYYRTLADERPPMKKYLRGWLNRTDAIRQWCLSRA